MININQALTNIIAGKEKIPISRVEVYDTTYTVPSSGFYVQYYSGVDTSDFSSLKRTQFESMIYKDWSNGLPVELSQYLGVQSTTTGIALADPYSIVYSGWFYADTAGSYNFATRSTGGTEIFVDGTQVLSGIQMINPTLTGYSSGVWSNKNLYWDGDITLATGWHPIRVNYYWPQSILGNDSMLTAFYTHPNPAIPQRVLSASVVNIHPEFIQPLQLNDIIYVSESVNDESAAQYTFETALTPTGLYTWTQAKNDFNKIKTNRLVNIYMGYVTEDDYNATNGYTQDLSLASGLIRKFTGMIDSATADQSQDSITVTVKCRDFFKKAINSINENFPNKASYTPTVLSSLDPFGTINIDREMPNAYDNWLIFDVIDDLCLKSNIDPVHLDRFKWDTQSFFKLESNLNWPTTTVTDLNGAQEVDGDPFIFKFEYGEYLYDEIKRVSDLIGFRTYFDEFGDLIVKEPRSTNRIEVYETGNYGSASVTKSGYWSLIPDINASNRIYITPMSGIVFTTGTVDVAFSGVGFSLIETLFISGSEYSIDIIDNTTQTSVYSDVFSSSGTTTQYGYTQEFTRDLPYGSYTAKIASSGNHRIEGFEYYSTNIYKPVYTLKDNVDIKSLSVDLNDESVRNEVIAVGQQIGDKSYLYSKSIDLDSISNPDSFNYVGEKKTFVIIEPTIQSQRRLDWLSSNVLERYRRKQRNIEVSCQGLPHIQIGDPVGIDSIELNMASSSISSFTPNNEEVFYVRNISSRLSEGSYKTNLTLTSLKPIESWRPPLSITSDILAAIYAANNNSVFANFRQVTLNAESPDYGYNGVSNEAAFLTFDMFVDFDRLWVLIGDTPDGGGLFASIVIDDDHPITTYQAAQGLEPDDPPQGGVWLHNAGGEKWGNITVPTAQNAFNGGQWAGQNSESNVRLDGAYPLAIWGQFRTADQSRYYQGVWVPTSGTLDNRNRVLANKPNGRDNYFHTYTQSTDQVVIQAPDIDTGTQAYLPAFVVKNTKPKINLWLGPVESGYQMVADNLLLDMSSKFDYFGNLWNPWPSPRFIDYATIPQSNVTLPNGSTMYAGGGPWATGDDMLSIGEMHPNPHHVWNQVFGATKFVPSTAHWKSTLGFAPQGFNFPSPPRPSYVLPQFDPLWQTDGDPVTEGHPFNQITITSDTEIYIKMAVWDLWPDSQAYAVQDYSTPYAWHNGRKLTSFDFQVPFKGPISMFLFDPRILVQQVGPQNDWISRLMPDKNDILYSRNNSVIYPDHHVPVGDMFIQTGGRNTSSVTGRPNLLATFEITEPKTNRRYNWSIPFNMPSTYFPTYAGMRGPFIRGLKMMKD